jgi:hypothetical protein
LKEKRQSAVIRGVGSMAITDSELVHAHLAEATAKKSKQLWEKE